MRIRDIVPKDYSFRKFSGGFECLYELIDSVGDINFFLAKDVCHRNSVCPVLDREHPVGARRAVNVLVHTSIPKVYDCLSISVLSSNFIRATAR